MNVKETASGYFGAMNCYQSVLSTFGPNYNLSKEQCFNLGISFLGGMGKQGKTCGAVTGSYTVIGLWCAMQTTDINEQKALAIKKVQEFNDLFETKNGSTECKTLLGYNMSIPEEAKLIQEKEIIPQVCPVVIGDAAEILEKILN